VHCKWNHGISDSASLAQPPPPVHRPPTQPPPHPNEAHTRLTRCAHSAPPARCRPATSPACAPAARRAARRMQTRPTGGSAFEFGVIGWGWGWGGVWGGDGVGGWSVVSRASREAMHHVCSVNAAPMQHPCSVNAAPMHRARTHSRFLTTSGLAYSSPQSRLDVTPWALPTSKCTALLEESARVPSGSMLFGWVGGWMGGWMDLSWGVRD